MICGIQGHSVGMNLQIVFMSHLTFPLFDLVAGRRLQFMCNWVVKHYQGNWDTLLKYTRWCSGDDSIHRGRMYSTQALSYYCNKFCLNSFNSFCNQLTCCKCSTTMKLVEHSEGCGVVNY